MACSKKKTFGSRLLINRRRFLQLAVGGLTWLTTGIRPAFAVPYRVGVGKLSDPYAATRRAVEASGEWPSAEISGKTVAIKPNLVAPVTAETGVTTAPEVVWALVDLALEAGAAQVFIIEGGFGGANFTACGYDVFNSYDPRVSLIDLNDEPLTLAKVPSGLAYHWIYIPMLLLADDVVFISAAKLKTHSHTFATLSMKNLIGLAPIDHYSYPLVKRLAAMHYRGISQVVVDLNLIRPIDYAVVDGIWAMEGKGPGLGDPVRMNMVIAGRNPVAVDRVCLWAMVLPQRGVQHLSYAVRKNLGPVSLDEITVSGDSFSRRLFKWPANLPPVVEYPRAIPYRFRPTTGQQVQIIYWIAFPCMTRVEIVHTREISPKVIPIRTIRDWESRPSGFEMLKWDGRDDNGKVVSPGWYTILVQAKYSIHGKKAYATGRVKVRHHSI